jgi:hypothetical protein
MPRLGISQEQGRSELPRLRRAAMTFSPAYPRRDHHTETPYRASCHSTLLGAKTSEKANENASTRGAELSRADYTGAREEKVPARQEICFD